MKFSVGGLAVGIVIAAIDIFLLVYLPSVANQFIRGMGADIGGTLSSVFLSTTAIALAVSLAVLAIPIRGVKEAPRVTGAAKLLQGIVLAAYYYVILNGGTVSLSLLYSNVDLVVTVTLLITLALLEASAIFRMLQGLFEMREHVPMPSGVPSSNSMVATNP
jgi:hypothetical protein